VDLQRWGFAGAERGSRGCWVRDDLRILLDVIDRADYVGLAESIRTETTAYGPVRVAAVEDLILQRLIFAKRERQAERLAQAALLWIGFGKELDTDSLAYQIRYEDVSDRFREMTCRAEAISPR
jgi:hypothetical protein